MAVRSTPLAQRPVAPPRQPVRFHFQRSLNFLLLFGFLALVPIAVERGERWWNRVRFSGPPTTMVRARVGHNDSGSQPTTFVAMNLDRQVVVLEMPGGNANQMQRLVGPYLVGAGEDQTPVELRVSDQTNDGQPDLVITIKGEEIMYVNTGTTFRLATPADRGAQTP